MNEIIAYVDGSYNSKEERVGMGVVFIHPETKNVIHEVKEEIFDQGIKSMRNVAGELSAVIKAISWAMENGYKKVSIFYDYAGIEKWITGEWKCKTLFTISYKRFVEKCKEDIAIEFHKVKAHSGDLLNEYANILASNACGNS